LTKQLQNHCFKHVVSGVHQRGRKIAVALLASAVDLWWVFFTLRIVRV